MPLPDPADLVLGPQHKSLPPSAWGSTVAAFLATGPHLSDLQTPLLTVDDKAVRHNTAAMAAWTAERGLLLAPHGKTTMAPALWRRFLDAGAWGVTLATAWQAQVAVEAGVRRILIANEVTDPVGIRWLRAALDAHPDLEIACWVDSREGVALLAAGLGPGRPLPVLVELGVPGGRAGARGLDAALDVADAVAAAPALRLAGAAGYEGPAGSDRGSASVDAVRAFLADLVALHSRLRERIDGVPLLTAGGSTYPDLVADALAPEAGAARAILRSGAYQVHDDGHYAALSPFGAAGTGMRLEAGIHAWARVLSRPEPGLAILDAGRRDVPFDLGLPVPQAVLGAPDEAVAGAAVVALNDQHAFLRLEPGRAALPVGAVVRFGLSHPCTAFDKWRLVPVLESTALPDPRVVDLVQTHF
ncbi:amino acid deaminase [Amnibacterium sp. CER49]|uniref:amino acid deaminase n=1 Tax=Amnibacterium sp. CER49 TaxID=3039161 RepID=UPI00244C3A08|nr:amino acid deaminase [Amnibacterium sp. CER49]MDH2444253.1 amino acid deaminase [Amnibacterium sp. CER49]